ALDDDRNSSRSQNMDRFIYETGLLARIRHPNIVRVRRVFKWENAAFMVFDHVKGRRLSSWLHSHGKGFATQDELDHILQPLLSAIEVIHRASHWHLDLSPETIVISEDGSPVIMCIWAPRTDFSAPERYVFNFGSRGPWTAIYALAGVLYRAV